MKRAFDATASFIGLVLLSPFFFVIALLVKLSSCGPIFYRQTRIGRKFVPFRLYKFRTMHEGPGPQITIGLDSRITTVGFFLRKYKLDEFPQLINVLLGEMSLVGPRPELLKYVSMFNDKYSRILTVKPGLTDPASICFSDEASLLAQFPDPERAYVELVLPKKITLTLAYLEQASFATDVKIIFQTLLRISSPKRNDALSRPVAEHGSNDKASEL